MEYCFIDKSITYDGTQLKSHWIFGQTGLTGDVIAGFCGPADVSLSHMVDLEDVAAGAVISSPLMLHFIAEHFSANLALCILRQRLLTAIACEALTRKTRRLEIKRRGDDLYDGDRKLSVSIATASPVSCLIHFGINIRSDGTPVPTKGLADYDVDPNKFAETVMKKYADEIKSAERARCKVRAVL